jgi:hypothetical protein
MKKNMLCSSLLLAFVIILIVSCKKQNSETNIRENLAEEKSSLSARPADLTNPPYDLNVTLRGACNSTPPGDEGDEDSGDCPIGHLKFRQDPDPGKIIDLDISVHNLLPNHEYLLQRAVDPINVVDGNCTSTTWLTLGKGLTPQLIFTDIDGNGEEELWRDVKAIPSGSKFDIHFQVIDAVTNVVLLTGDCYQYQVR